MVHALRESWRVLRPGGVLLDLRPIARQAPIELVDGDETVPLCQLDGSKGEPSDAACERALDEVASEGLFTLERTVRFEFAIYWDSVRALTDFVEESSTRYALPSPPELEAIQRRADPSPHARCRMWEDVTLARYRRSRHHRCR